MDVRKALRGGAVCFAFFTCAAAIATPVYGDVSRTLAGSADALVWLQQKLTESGGVYGDYFGNAVAISRDGSTALVGSPSATVGGNVGQGATYLYTDSSGAWTQTDELSARDGVAYDTSSTVVSLSHDGTLLTSDGCHPYDQNTYTCGPGAAYAFKASDLSAALSTPTTVQSDAQFDSKYIVTNASATASGAVSVELPVPGTSVGYVSSIASQGTCSYDSSSHAVDCALGSMAGNGGTAWASLTLKATGTAGTTIDQSAQVANAKPDLAQKGYTTITKASSGGSNNSSTDGGGGAFGWLGLLALLAVAILLGRDSTNTRDHAPQS